jgi:hypothetical protein
MPGSSERILKKEKMKVEVSAFFNRRIPYTPVTIFSL